MFAKNPYIFQDFCVIFKEVLASRKEGEKKPNKTRVISDWPYL